MGIYNVDKIQNLHDTFVSAHNKYNNAYYSDFKNSYIFNCGDPDISRMKKKLDAHYSKIYRINKRIKNIWEKYINDLKGIDKRLAGQKVSLNDSTLTAKISKLPQLNEYKVTLGTKINSASANIGTVKGIGWAEDKTVVENLAYVSERTKATITVAGVSVVEGLAVFGEGLMDLCSPIVTEGYCQFNLAFNEDFTKEKAEEARKNSRDFVAKEHVKSYFDKGYENSPGLMEAREKAYGFETVRSVGNEIGEVVPAAVISMIPGVGQVLGPAVYGVAKAGNHIEENFKDTNKGYFESIIKGSAEGAFDGLFFAAGMKGDAAMKSMAASAVNNGEKIALKKASILFGKTLYECGCSVAQDGANIMVNAFFSEDKITESNGNVIKLDTFDKKMNYYYEQAGGINGIVTSMATAGILSFASDYVDINKIGKNVNPNAAVKNADINTSGVKKNMGDINSKNIDVSSGNRKVNPDVNINSIKKEYNELLNKSKEPWFVNAKEAGDNHWAWDLNEVVEVDKTIKRMQELESTLGIKNTGVPESKIYDYSQAKKEADAMVQKIKNKPIPGFENIDTNSQEYKKAMQEIYSKPSPSGKQDLSQINLFNKNEFTTDAVYPDKLSLKRNNNEIKKAFENLDIVMKNIEAKYPGQSVAYLSEYLKTGNINYITSAGGSRDYVASLNVELVNYYFNSRYGFNIRSKATDVRNIQNKALLNSSNSIELYSFFKNSGSSLESTYGVDQGGISRLCKYYFDGKEYNYREAMKIVNAAKDNGQVIPRFQKIDTKEYRTLKDKLISAGFTRDQASVLMSSVNDVGACSYAAKANSIFYKFHNNPDLFQQKFGFPMYLNQDGKRVLNSNELLLDMYLFVNDTANGGKLFSKNYDNSYTFFEGTKVDVFGRKMLNVREQSYMSNINGSNNSLLDRYMDSKGLKWSSYNLISNPSNNILTDAEFNQYINAIESHINKGQAVQLNIFSNGGKIDMHSTHPDAYKDMSTASWVRKETDIYKNTKTKHAGHSVFITGLDNYGFFVSSWGKEYKILFKDLKNGGCFNIMIDDVSSLNY